MSNMVEVIMKKLSVVFEAAEDELNAFDGNDRLQVPALVTKVALKLNWDEKQARELDPLVRFYVKNNSNWHVSRGAKGGIVRASVKEAADLAKASKEALKNQMKASLESSPVVPLTDVVDNVIPLTDSEVSSDLDSTQTI